MKYFIIARDPKDAWAMQHEVDGLNAGNTFLFHNTMDAKSALRQLKLDAREVRIVYREDGKVLQKLATLFFSL